MYLNLVISKQVENINALNYQNKKKNGESLPKLEHNYKGAFKEDAVYGAPGFLDKLQIEKKEERVRK